MSKIFSKESFNWKSTKSICSTNQRNELILLNNKLDYASNLIRFSSLSEESSPRFMKQKQKQV